MRRNTLPYVGQVRCPHCERHIGRRYLICPYCNKRVDINYLGKEK